MKEVDAIYIASPHQTHYEYAKRALEQGKHVLCEKPLAFKRAEAEELFAIAREHGVVLLEAIKTAYCPGFVQLVGIAKSGVIGRICDVEACFTDLQIRDCGRERIQLMEAALPSLEAIRCCQS